MTDSEGSHGGQQVERHGGDVTGMVMAVTHRKSADHHVGIADRLHFVDVIAADDGVEQCVEVVKQVHHLNQTAIQHSNRSCRGR